MPMSSARSLQQILDAMAADPYWASAASHGAPPELPDRHITRSTAGVPCNLDVFDLERDHERNVAAVVAKYGQPAPQSRLDVYAAADALAAAVPGAGADLAAAELTTRLQARIVVGDGLAAVAAITCPDCGCWSLVPVRSIGGWRATCTRRSCNNPSQPRTWSLRAIAEHHLRDPWAA